MGALLARMSARTLALSRRVSAKGFAHMSSFISSGRGHANDEGGRVVPFERPQTAPRRPGVEPHVDGGGRSSAQKIANYAHGGDDDDYSHRMKMNAIALTILVLLVVCGLWIADTIAQMRTNQDCVLSGRRACAPIDVFNLSR